MILAHVQRDSRAIYLYESGDSYFDANQPSEKTKKIFGDTSLRLSRTITRQCGIKFSWEFKRGPDAEIRDKKTKNLCGIYILHLADILLSGEIFLREYLVKVNSPRLE
jgi:hypothetical protein